MEQQHGPLIPLTLTASAIGGQTQHAPEIVQIWPAGGLATLTDGRGSFRVADADAVIAASLAGAAGNELPIDYDHALDYGQENGASGRAAGWISELEGREDGSIWGRVTWTAAGRAVVEGREYRFLSPVFDLNKAGQVGRIPRVALTNRPAIHSIKPVAASERRHMDEELLKAIRKALGLADDADTTAIVTAAEAVVADKARLETEVATVTAAAKDNKPDPALYMPRKAYDELSARVTAMEAAGAASTAEQLVQTASAEGKLSPSLADWGLAYAKSDPDGFKAWAAAAPKLITAGEMLTVVPDDAQGDRLLTASERQVIAQTGLSEEDYLAERKRKADAAKGVAA